MVINTNVAAQAAVNNLQMVESKLAKSLARLSSGSRIISPADDAAGLAVASRIEAQVQRTNAAKSNVSNAVSFTQAQDGYLKKIGKAFDRMSELTILAQDVTRTDADRALYDNEFTQLASYVTTAATKDFNGVSLFSVTPLDITIDSDGSTFAMDGLDLTAAEYADATSASVATIADAASALTDVKTAINKLLSDRASIGAYQSRLNLTSEQLMISSENLMAVSSRIQDVDVAEVSTQYARENILVQSGTAMLAQANQLPQNVLRLLQ